MTEPEIRRHFEEHGDALRLAAKLGRLADQGRLEGVEINVVDDVVMMSPVSLEHSETCDELIVQLRPQARSLGLRLAGDVEFRHPEWDEDLAPDLAVWEAGGEEQPSPLPADSVVLAVEVVSRSSVTKDYAVKARAYRRARIPAYVILDPYTRSWTLHSERAMTQGGYGDSLELSLPDGGVLELDTATLPHAPKTRQRDAWPQRLLELPEI